VKIKINCSKKSLSISRKSYPCAIGVDGFIPEQDGREGDGKTPLGTYPLRYGLYRADRIEVPETELEMHKIREDDGWCDAPDDPAYNRLVRLPYPASVEELYRDSQVYDVVLVLAHNDNPPIPDMGSAIFIHIAREGYKPTQGCVAISKEDMLEVLPKSKPGMDVEITA
jgi:L,D-peptidoglycan transpeptidase YkuD (ErfK/YbiS/YcfS/YnhG family)